MKKQYLSLHYFVVMIQYFQVVIILNYSIKSKNFFLGLDLQVFESDISITSVNAIIKLKVKSFGYTGDSELNIKRNL